MALPIFVTVPSPPTMDMRSSNFLRKALGAMVLGAMVLGAMVFGRTAAATTAKRNRGSGYKPASARKAYLRLAKKGSYLELSFTVSSVCHLRNPGTCMYTTRTRITKQDTKGKRGYPL